jgi:riboflavin-specific deaminase-like protein
MRALLPHPAPDADLVQAYAVPAQGDRPFVRCNMIISLDGAISVNGRSGMLGGPADRQVFQVLRSVADVILVGAGTVRSERYGPARLSDDLRSQREQRGQSPVPPIAVVTRSGNLDWSSPFFVEAEERPTVFTTSDCDPGERRRGSKVAEVVTAGDERVELPQVIDHLWGAGRRSVLLEGGPGLNGQMVDAGLLDELCLTMAPRLVAGSGPRLLDGPELPRPLDLELAHLLEDDGYLFYRLAVRGPAP